jgi:hypothetical protein
VYQFETEIYIFCMQIVWASLHPICIASPQKKKICIAIYIRSHMTKKIIDHAIFMTPVPRFLSFPSPDRARATGRQKNSGQDALGHPKSRGPTRANPKPLGFPADLAAMAGSTAVLAAILLIDLVAFGLAIGAEQSRPSVRPALRSFNIHFIYYT